MTEILLQSKLKNLCNVVSDLERTEKSIIENLSKYKNFNLNNYLVKLDSKRNDEQADIKKTLKALIESVQEKIKIFKQDGFPAGLDIETFKTEMMTIQNLIDNSKHSARENLTYLIHEEEALTNDVEEVREQLKDATQKKLIVAKENRERKKLNKPKAHKKKGTAQAKSLAELLRLAATCEDMDKIVRKYQEYKKGTTENVIEFSEFLKTLNDYKQKQNPNNLKPKSVKKKVDDHLNVNVLKEKLNGWKNERNIVKNITKYTVQSMSKVSNKSTPKVETPISNKSTSRVGTPRYNKGNPRVGTPNNKVVKKIDNYLDIPVMKEGLGTWQNERIDQVKCFNAMKRYYRAECNSEAQVERHRRAIIKENIRKWKEECEKINENHKLKQKVIDEIRKRNQKEINKNLKYYQKRDKIYTQKMRQVRCPSIPMKAKQKTRGLSNPLRLLKATNQWMNRINDTSKRSFTDSNLNAIGKLSIPDWRKTIH